MSLIHRTDLFKLADCWLSPKGEVIVGDEDEILHAYHENLAECIIREMKGFETTSDARMWFLETQGGNAYAYDWLEQQGWIRLHGFRESDRARWITFQDQKLTFHQKQKIRQWCKVNNKTWDEAVQVC